MSGVPAAAAPFLASALVLATAGVAKARAPEDTARALQIAGLPAHRQLVRAGAVAEVAVAVSAVVAPGRITASLVGLAYLAFTTFVGVALVNHWPLSSCGCFGRPDDRPGPAHLVLDAAACAAAAFYAWEGPEAMGPLLRHSPWGGGPLILVTAVIAGLAYLVWTNPVNAARAAA
ncbi:MAG TPA: MauE/DoxX family redox-associated membrane protein [Acidimicrobiales bacterium]|nr:MauE/DoxX family redox-associated membrane protein [Acidimicrobiales bacterium]